MNMISRAECVKGIYTFYLQHCSVREIEVVRYSGQCATWMVVVPQTSKCSVMKIKGKVWDAPVIFFMETDLSDGEIEKENLPVHCS